jgi:large subunit ribosomal protein L16
MDQPRRTKYRKMQKGRRRGAARRGNTLLDGEFGLMALEAGWITARQREAARIAMTRHIKRHGRVYIRFFPDKPITKKPAEVRMGKGKGAPELWVSVVRPGRILYEIKGVPEELAREAMVRAQHKMPIKTRVVSRSDEL